MSARPHYRVNPTFKAQRVGRKYRDELTGQPGVYEAYLIYQNGLWKNSKNRGSVYTYYGGGLFGLPPGQ